MTLDTVLGIKLVRKFSDGKEVPLKTSIQEKELRQRALKKALSYLKINKTNSPEQEASLFIKNLFETRETGKLKRLNRILEHTFKNTPKLRKKIKNKKLKLSEYEDFWASIILTVLIGNKLIEMIIKETKDWGLIVPDKESFFLRIQEDEYHPFWRVVHATNVTPNKVKPKKRGNRKKIKDPFLREAAKLARACQLLYEEKDNILPLVTKEYGNAYLSKNLFSRIKVGSLTLIINKKTGRWVCTDKEEKFPIGIPIPNIILSKEEKEAFESLSAKINYSVRIKPSLLVVFLGNECNLSCKYCFTHTSDKKKTDIEKIISRIKEVNRITGVSKIQFFGGEPLLHFKEIKQIVKEFPSENFKYSIQTNGTLITQEVCDFLKEYKRNINIGISIDGPKKYNDINRIFPDGSGSYSRIIEGIKLLKKNKIRFSIISTLTKSTLTKRKAEIMPETLFKWAHEIGAVGIRINPVKAGGRANKQFEIEPEIFFKFMKSATITYFKKEWEKKILFENIYDYINNLTNPPWERKNMCFENPCGAGKRILAILPNGNIAPCPSFAEWSTRKPLEEALFSEKFEKLRNRRTEIIGSCKDCDIRGICGGGRTCAVYYHYKELNKPDPLCPFYKKFYPWLACYLTKNKINIKRLKVSE